MPSAKLAIGIILLILVLAAFGLLFSGGGGFPGGPPPVTTVTSIEYIYSFKNWDQRMLDYLSNNVSVFSVGDVIGVAGFGVKVNSIQVLDAREYIGGFQGATRTVIYKAVIAERGKDSGINVIDEGKFVIVDVTFMRVSEGEIPKANVVVTPGLLSILINPFLLIFGGGPEERNLSILKIVVSFDGKWVVWRKEVIDPNASRTGLNLEKDIGHPIGWSERGKLLFIVPKGARDIEVVITLSPDCPVFASGPICQPGIPIARVKVS